MPTLTFIAPDEKEYNVEAENGLTLMDAAVDNSVPGIDADCGGSCACATCHVILPSSFLKNMDEVEEDESSLLDFLDNREENSRLSCQITIDDTLEGMTVIIPEAG